MKNLVALALLAFTWIATPARAQSLANCENSPSVIACVVGGPSNTGTGDSLEVVGAKYNSNFLWLSPLWTLPANVLVGSNTANTLTYITIGANLSLSGGVLSATGGGGGGGTGTSTNGQILYNNSGAVGGLTLNGSGNPVGTTSPSLTTPNVNAATATSINGNTFPVVTGDVFVLAAAAQTLTNKSIASTEITGLGTFATQNYATPPAIGATTPAAGSFSTLTDTGVTGLTQCAQFTSAGVLTGTGSTCPGSAGTLNNIANGITPMGTAAIASGGCASPVAVTATGVYTSDVINVTTNGNITTITGYIPSASGMLTILPYTSPNAVNYLVCNNTASSITPGPISLNWSVHRASGPLVAFVQVDGNWGGTTSPQVSGTFQPATYGTNDVLIGHWFGAPSGTIGATGTTGTWNTLSSLADSVGNKIAALDNTTSTTAAGQTATWTLSGTPTGLYGRIWEYTHASTIAGYTQEIDSPGTGSFGPTAETVPAGGVLFCAGTDMSGGVMNILGGTTRGNSGTAFVTQELTNNTGSSTSMQCLFQLTTGTDKTEFESWVLSP